MGRPIDSEAARVTWAKHHSGRTWEQLADGVGCSHAGLPLWGSGKTSLSNAKLHLVLAFCRETGVNLPWLVSGEGTAIDRYAIPPVVQEAHRLAVESPALADTGYRLLRALRSPDGTADIQKSEKTP